MASTPDDSPQYNAEVEEALNKLWLYIRPDDPKEAGVLRQKLYSFYHIKEIPYD